MNIRIQSRTKRRFILLAQLAFVIAFAVLAVVSVA